MARRIRPLRCKAGVCEAETTSLTELWQGCGKKPDFTAKTDIIDRFQLPKLLPNFVPTSPESCQIAPTSTCASD